MKLFMLLLAVPFLMSETCKNKKTETTEAGETPVETSNNIPKCIQQKIDSIKVQPRWSPPAEVNEYSYMGKKIFLFSADCCDFYNIAVDSACKYICAPTGGFTGKGDGKCADFEQQAKFVKQVWKDKREK